MSPPGPLCETERGSPRFDVFQQWRGEKSCAEDSPLRNGEGAGEVRSALGLIALPHPRQATQPAAPIPSLAIGRIPQAGVCNATGSSLPDRGESHGLFREAFRQRADRDVEAVITQKNVVPGAQVQNWHAYPDPRARFANPPGEVQDYPPYPPDDYYAWLTSPNPQRPGRGGAGRYEGQLYLEQICAWDASNRAEDEANRPKENPTGGDAKRAGEDDKPKPPDAEQGTAAVGSVAGSAVAGYLATFATNERAFRIRFDQAVELALFNSREFQDRREDLYLAALPVTFERFTFAAQAFASEQLIRQSTGRDFPGGGSELWTLNGTLGFNRRFATGAELLVGSPTRS